MVYEVSRTAEHITALMTWEGESNGEMPAEALELLNSEERDLYDMGMLHWVIGVGPLLPISEEQLGVLKEQLRQFLKLTGLV